MRRDQILMERFNALIRLIEQDGASAAGDLPPADYLSALRSVNSPEQHREIEEAHREGRGPPDFAGRRGPPNQGDGS
ncbi:hypothetical protein [Haloplanus rubicundus]|uniref:hypothetical protein n=1 Tax=Haloplanus rubicundus TaxID=1547898 RepID=UPI001651141E|nr:hypothetical protein [Haloplanus rubicundus]